LAWRTRIVGQYVKESYFGDLKYNPKKIDLPKNTDFFKRRNPIKPQNGI
jgi:hypothetical protein